MTRHPLAFEDLPGWAGDDHAAALRCFRHSFTQLRAAFPALPEPDGAISARQYFESHFQPQRIESATGNGDGLLTGYYEPVLAGARTRSARYPIPLLRRPDDLETLRADSLRASADATLTHARRTSLGLEPYPTRQEIEQGCLADSGLELLFLADPIDAFFLHIQGSGVVELDDGSRVRVTYAAKNGHPYTSIGKTLIDEGAIAAEDMSLQTLRAWLAADRARAERVMWRNKSYIFFSELGDAASVDQVGVHDIPLTPGRSIAVDASIHAIGLPLFISARELPGQPGACNRLMIAQDVGSAIRGAARADIFYGSGAAAGERAGMTRHHGTFYRLRPRDAH